MIYYKEKVTHESPPKGGRNGMHNAKKGKNMNGLLWKMGPHAY
jgi:hypothetical protein